MLVIAHAGHWALSLIEFFPLLAIATFIAYRTLAITIARPARAGLAQRARSPTRSLPRPPQEV